MMISLLALSGNWNRIRFHGRLRVAHKGIGWL